jgi:iron(III) transport system substrate-binding protein
MSGSGWTRRRYALLGGAVLILLVGLAAAAIALGGSADVVVFNGRSQYGDEQVFKDFEEETGLKVELRGGTAPELFERMRREGEATDGDLLVTTDLANLWRAEDAGLLDPIETEALRANVAPAMHDPAGAWWGMSSRVRTPMRSTERVPDEAIRRYEDLGKPRFRGRLCLRTSNNEYNQSFVADRLVKDGPAATEKLLRSWMDNEPEILGSDIDVLDAIASGRCDVGLTNHYYLARELEEKPDFPVAPAWADQGGRGAHANLSGVGLVKDAEHRDAAIRLMEYLTARHAQELIVENGEFAANSDVPPADHIREWADVKTDVIDVERAGGSLDEAVALMQRVGWE